MDYLDRCPSCKELVPVIPEWREEKGMQVLQQSRCCLCKITWRDRFLSLNMFYPIKELKGT